MTATSPAARQIARCNSYPGQRVTATFRDGTTVTGTLTAWGTQVIRISVKTSASGKRSLIERSTSVLDQVTEAS